MAIFQSQGLSTTDPEAWDVPAMQTWGAAVTAVPEQPRGKTFAAAQMSWPVSSQGTAPQGCCLCL